MKKSLLLLLNLTAALLLSACGGGSSRNHFEPIPQENIPPLHVDDKVIGKGEPGTVSF